MAQWVRKRGLSFLGAVLIASLAWGQESDRVNANVDVLINEALFGYFLKSEASREYFRERFGEAAFEKLTPRQQESFEWGETGFCPLGSFELAGEKLRIQGGTGGGVYPTVDPAKPFGEYAGLLERFYPGADLSGTELIVIDEFTQSVRQPSQDSHGKLVLDHLVALLTNALRPASYALPSFSSTSGVPAAELAVGGSNLRLRLVDHRNDPGTLHSIFEQLSWREPGSPVIVNMSFSIVPCATRDDAQTRSGMFRRFRVYQNHLLAHRDNRTQLNLLRENLASSRDDDGLYEALRSTLEGGSLDGSFFLDAFGALVTPEALNEFIDQLVREDLEDQWTRGERVLLRRYLLTPYRPSSDQTLQALSEPTLEPDTVYVAAAGNYADSLPTYPAAFPNVIAVSSHDCQPRCYENAHAMSVFSNAGQVALPGASFLRVASASPSFVEGTSFASPTLSVWLAAELYTSTTGATQVRTLQGLLKQQNFPLFGSASSLSLPQ